MAIPTLTPSSVLSAITLPSTGSYSSVNAGCPYKIYSEEGDVGANIVQSPLYSHEFVSGAVDQVSFVYKKLGGDVLDIELTEENVYAAYEEAVLEYSYLVNLHQATNILSDALGNATASFDHKGLIMSGALSASLDKSHVALKYPKFDYGMVRRIGEGISAEVGLQGSVQFSASFDVTPSRQDYDLQEIISTRKKNPASTKITISNNDDIDSNDTLTFNATNGAEIILTVTAGTTNDHRLDPRFAQAGTAQLTAQNMCLAMRSIDHFTASSDENVVTITQTDGGPEGNTVIVSTTEAGDPGWTIGTAEGVTRFVSGSQGEFPYAGKIEGKKILVKKVYYKTPHAMWRFYGYYGGLNVVGNLHNYGQFSDDSTFQLIPTWHNKSQALAFEDAIYTRMSHFSYELRNNKLRIFPQPENGAQVKMWVEFSIPTDVWDNDDKDTTGINNMNTLPLGNLPFVSINAIGKQWIRRFSLSLSKEVLVK